MKAKIIFDTNFLLIPTQFNIDIFDEAEKLIDSRYEKLIPYLVYREINDLLEGNSVKLKKQANIAMKFVKKAKIIGETEHYENTDESIVHLAKNLNCYVATNDSLLRRRLRKHKIPVIYLRQRSHLAIDR
jgi:rRNA-processing protein FCF1